MVKKITGYVKLQVPAGSASPSPPIGPALGQAGLNIMDFCKAFNAQTEKLEKEKAKEERKKQIQEEEKLKEELKQEENADETDNDSDSDSSGDTK